MPSIGYATLQIIPSLKGVSEAIEKQIDGKAVSVSIEPKVDPKAAEAAGKETRAAVEDAAKGVKVEPKVAPKVDKGAAEKAGKDAADHAKVTPAVEPKVDKGAAERAGKAAADHAKVEPEVAPKTSGGALRAFGEALMAQIGPAGVQAGKKIASSINESIKADGFRGAASKIGKVVTDGLGRIGPTAGKALTASLGTAVTMGAPVVVQKLNDALSRGVNKVGGSDLANTLVGGLDTAQGKVSTFVDGATSSISSFSSVLDDVQNVLGGPDSFAAPGIAALQDGLAKATPLLDGMSAATRIATAVQGTFNVVMRANPIGIVVTALTALVGGLTWFFTKTEMGQQIWEKFTEYLKVAWEWIKSAFETGWNVVKSVFTGWIDTAGKVWESVKDKFGKIVGFVKDLPGKIARAASGMWDGIKNAFKSMINSIIKLWNNFAGKMKFSAPSWVPGIGGKEFSLPTIAEFAAGGFTGRVPADEIAGVVHGGEYVIKKASTTILENAYPGLLDYLNKKGKLPGYAEGGLVAGTAELRKIIGERFGIGTIYGYRGEDGYGEHSTGRALDVMVGDDATTGDAVKDFAVANASAIDLKWAIWKQRLWYPDGSSEAMETRAGGDPTQNHFDHVHIFSGPGITGGLLGALKAKDSDTGSESSGHDVAPLNGSSDYTTPDTTGITPSSSGTSAGTSLTDSVPTSLSGFGAAAGEFVDGQVSSALGVLGVPDSPGWLQGISKFVGGLSISDASGNKVFGGSSIGGLTDVGSMFGAGGDGFGGAAPIAAASAPRPAAAPAAAEAHGAQAGQPPGPTVNYNIRTATVEDAFLQAQRIQDVKSRARLDRF